ncbi:hypothetical protein V5O48_001403 [Marasmius crinis-equi]|uniref:LYC1 C-terminal domain-containing protein n=1 Tax=Marasmius crinis-equi TaxID=585013 RepID=A0ABR3FYJ0_9AGAR
MAIDTDFSSLSLFLATPAQVVESYRRTTKEWGRGQSEGDYIRHNQWQAQTFECAKEGKWVVWVLAPREDSETLRFKCACETYQRPGLVLAPNTNEPEDVACYGIASVFTPPAERGKGYARHMMRLLHWVLSKAGSLPPSSFPKEWGSPPPRAEAAGNGQFSALWSDVGHFYDRCGPFGGDQGGWHVKDHRSTLWDVQIVPQDALHPHHTGLQWEWLDEETVKHLWEDDVRAIRAEMASLGPNPVSTFFTFLPSSGLETFQREKLKFLWQKEGITEWGVKVKHPEQSLGASDFATWTLELSAPSPRTLLITRLRAHRDSFPIIFSRAAEVAKKHGLERIEVWNLDEGLQDAVSAPGKTIMREEHLPAVQWYGEGAAEDLVWLNNEK